MLSIAPPNVTFSGVIIDLSYFFVKALSTLIKASSETRDMSARLRTLALIRRDKKVQPKKAHCDIEEAWDQIINVSRFI